MSTTVSLRNHHVMLIKELEQCQAVEEMTIATFLDFKLLDLLTCPVNWYLSRHCVRVLVSLVVLNTQV